MKNLKYIILIYFIFSAIFIIQSNIIKDAFPFYPYDEILKKNFKEYCLNLNLKEDCIISKLSDINITQINKISYDFIKTNYQNQVNPSIIGDIFENALKGFLGTYEDDNIGVIGPIVISGISSLATYGKKLLNDKNEQIILEVEELLKNEKYQNLVNEWLKKDIEKLIKESLSQLDKNKYIKDLYLKQENLDKNFDLKSIFKANINSLNFIIFGKKGVGKSKIINNILGLKSGIDGPKENETDSEFTNVKFNKYKNNNKLGIELIEANGDDFKNVLKEFDLYFNDKIITDEKEFIYEIIYITNNNLLEEKNDLNQLFSKHYGKIPLKIIKFNNEKEKENKYINYILEELTENKLKNIYKYYYSLNVYKIITNKLILTNKLVDIFSSIPKNENKIKNSNDATNLIINKLKLNINTLLLNPILNYEEISNSIKNIYSKFFNELNEDFKKENISYTLEENQSSLNVLNYFIENHPNDIIPILFYEKIRTLLEEIFINEIKEIIINFSFYIEKYPDYLNIIDIIYRNFIRSPYKTLIWLLIIILVILVLIIIFKYVYRYIKKNKKEEIHERELDEIIVPKDKK